MFVAVDAVAAKMGGARRHLDGFLKVLANGGRRHEFSVFINDSIPLDSVSPNVRLYRVSAGGSSLRLFLWQQFILDRWCVQNRVDVLVCLLNFGPFRPRVKQILFQRNPIYFCDYYLSQAGAVGRLDAKLRRSIAYRAMCSAVKIVTPSMAMSKMVMQRYPQLLRDKFAVIRHGFDASSFAVTCEDNSWSPPSRLPNEIRLLYASHAALHKGIDVAIDTIAELVQAGVNARLFLTMSMEDWPSGIKNVLDRVANLGLQRHIVLTGRIEQQVMPSLYRHFDVFLFPSLCESFGFTMLEALSAGLPVVAADTPINREILSHAALYYSPLNAREAAAQVLSIIKQDELRSRLKDQARRRIDDGDWGWERYAREFLHLVESLSA